MVLGVWCGYLLFCVVVFLIVVLALLEFLCGLFGVWFACMFRWLLVELLACLCVVSGVLLRVLVLGSVFLGFAAWDVGWSFIWFRGLLC